MITEDEVNAAHNMMMAELFILCQPNNGDVFAFMDDRKDIVRKMLEAAKRQRGEIENPR